MDGLEWKKTKFFKKSSKAPKWLRNQRSSDVLVADSIGDQSYPSKKISGGLISIYGADVFLNNQTRSVLDEFKLQKTIFPTYS